MATLPAQWADGLKQRLCDALGLAAHEVVRLVIVAEPESLVTVYVTGFVSEDQLRRLAEAFVVVPVADIQVTDGREGPSVVVTPK